MILNIDLIHTAVNIAEKHIKRGFFESDMSVIVRRIKLQSDIYRAIRDVRKLSDHDPNRDTN